MHRRLLTTLPSLRQPEPRGDELLFFPACLNAEFPEVLARGGREAGRAGALAEQERAELRDGVRRLAARADAQAGRTKRREALAQQRRPDIPVQVVIAGWLSGRRRACSRLAPASRSPTPACGRAARVKERLSRDSGDRCGGCSGRCGGLRCIG